MTVLQKAESLLGRMLRRVRSSEKKLAAANVQATGAGAISLVSMAFQNNAPIPRKYSAEAENVSPPLSWSGVPAGAAELVLVCEDPDAPMPQPFVHWILYHIPPTTNMLPENVPVGTNPATIPGAMQSRNGAKVEGYYGPRPPLGHGVHHYHFQLFALDQRLNASENPSKDDLLKAMQGHVLADGELVGTYERKA